MKKKKIILTVTTDLTYDQRMQRISSALAEKYEVLLVGRKKVNSLPLSVATYQQKRLNCWWQKGKLFYVEYNIRLFFYLLFQPCDAICGIDLDTILPAFGVAKLRRKIWIYDSHEYFTEMEEIVTRPSIQKIWQGIEKFVLPQTKYAYTVCESIADIYKKLYGVPFATVRNVAQKKALNSLPHQQEPLYFIYAGAVNEGRGLEEMIIAFQYIKAELWICGEGDVLPQLKILVNSLNLNEKVKFLGYVLPQKLHELTLKAYAGFLLLQNKGKSYYYSLANKFFDYMHAGIPQITINFPEYRTINEKYQFAHLIDLDVEAIVEAANLLLNQKDYYEQLRQNALKAQNELNWEKEKEKLLLFYEKVMN